MFVAIENNKIVGTISFQGNKIKNLFTFPAKQRKGIGTKLLQKIEPIIKKRFKKIVVYSSLDAVPFYKKMNFESKKKIIKKIDSTGIRQILMEKNLQKINKKNLGNLPKAENFESMI